MADESWPKRAIKFLTGLTREPIEPTYEEYLKSKGGGNTEESSEKSTAEPQKGKKEHNFCKAIGVIFGILVGGVCEGFRRAYSSNGESKKQTTTEGRKETMILKLLTAIWEFVISLIKWIFTKGLIISICVVAVMYLLANFLPGAYNFIISVINFIGNVIMGIGACIVGVTELLRI